MLETARIPFLFVPKKFKEKFTEQVLEAYYSHFETTDDVVGETSIRDKMYDDLNRSCMITIYEDEQQPEQFECQMAFYFWKHLSNEKAFGNLKHDIILVFEKYTLSHCREQQGTYHYLPFVEVW